MTTIRDDLDATFGTRWRNPPTQRADSTRLFDEAMDLLVGDHARELVPEPGFSRIPFTIRTARGAQGAAARAAWARGAGYDECQAILVARKRDPIDILREIGDAHFRLTEAAIDGGDLTFGAELIRRLVGELYAP